MAVNVLILLTDGVRYPITYDALKLKHKIDIFNVIPFRERFTTENKQPGSLTTER